MPLSKAKNAELMRRIRYNRKLNAGVVVPKTEDKRTTEPAMVDYGIQSIDADGNPVYND